MNLEKIDGYERIFCIEGFLDEYNTIVCNSEKDIAILNTRLAMLDKLGRKALETKNFEILSDTKEKICSIRFPKRINNQRVLYYYYDENEAIILLTVFKEKSSKDYKTNIKKAEKIVKDFK